MKLLRAALVTVLLVLILAQASTLWKSDTKHTHTLSSLSAPDKRHVHVHHVVHFTASRVAVRNHCSPVRFLNRNPTTPAGCMGLILQQKHFECNQDFFQYDERGDGNCGCIKTNTSCSNLTDGATNLFRIDRQRTDAIEQNHCVLPRVGNKKCSSLILIIASEPRFERLRKHLEPSGCPIVRAEEVRNFTNAFPNATKKYEYSVEEQATHLIAQAQMNAVKQFLSDKKYESAFIFEHDAILAFSTPIAPKIWPQIIQDLPVGWDMLNMGRCLASCRGKNIRTVSNACSAGTGIVEGDYPFCLHAYAISRTGGEKFVDWLDLEAPSRGLDYETRRLSFDMSYKPRTVHPQLNVSTPLTGRFDWHSYSSAPRLFDQLRGSEEFKDAVHYGQLEECRNGPNHAI